MKPPRILAPKAPARAIPIVTTLDEEILEEKRANLARLTITFEAKLSAWRAAEAEPGELAPERQRRLLDDAAEALWQFVVQREACGLRNTEAVLREYDVPAALRLRMGARRRR